MMRQAPSRALALACLLIANAALLSPVGEANLNRTGWMGAETSGTLLYQVIGGGVARVEARGDEARRLKERDTSLPLTALAPVTDQVTGLKIVLRATPQLQSY